MNVVVKGSAKQNVHSTMVWAEMMKIRPVEVTEVLELDVKQCLGSWKIRSCRNGLWRDLTTTTIMVLLVQKVCHTSDATKKMSIAAKSLVENFGKEGLPIGKVAMMFNLGDQTFASRDC